MKNIHILPTDKPSRLHLAYGKDYYLSVEPFVQLDTKNYKTFNIYITSNEEIKEGDKDFYIIANDRDKTWINRLEKVVECKIDPKHGKVLILSSGFIYVDEGCKIILTTDQDLIKDGVQAIDDEFLEWFVKNPSCEEIELEEIEKYKSTTYDQPDRFIGYDYKIIIPKEEPKQEKDDSYIKEQKERRRKLFNLIDELEEKKLQEQPKQETLEEAAEKYIETSHYMNKDRMTDIIFGAKWQAERMYSEEDLKQFAFECVANFLSNNDNKVEIKLVDVIIDRVNDKFEQFKKK
jgi:hypothetical protein